jgi:hypothetical protein
MEEPVTVWCLLCFRRILLTERLILPDGSSIRYGDILAQDIGFAKPQWCSL